MVATDPTITITSPYAYQTRKADALFEAIFTLSGTITDLPAGAFAEYQVDDGSWIQAPTDGNGNFSTDVVITKQQNITVRVSTHPLIADTVSYVTAANTWLAWWQSNESGRGSSTQNTIRNELTDSDPRPTMFKNGVWQRLADPTSEDSTGGSTWVRIAVEFAKIGIPIGLINVAVGGTSIERWLPSSNDLWDTRIMQEVTEADCGGISFTTSLGGESNVGTDGPTLRAWLEEMINALHAEFGTNHYLTYVPRSYENGAGDTLRGEFDYVIANNPYCLFGGDTSVVDLSVNSDGTHLNSSSQVNEAALIRFAAFTAPEEAQNQPPVANAGPDQSVAAGVEFILDGSGSQDTDGTIVEWRWTQTAGDPVILNTSTPSQPKAISPSRTSAQTLTFQLITVDDDGEESTPGTVNVNVAAVVLSEILKVIERLDFDLVTQGDVNAYFGRANREVMKLKPSDPTGLALDADGFMMLDSNTIEEVKVIAEGSSISSKTDSINLEGSEMLVRLGDLEASKNGNIYFSIVVFVEGDTKGVVVSSKGSSGNKPMSYVTL